MADTPSVVGEPLPLLVTERYEAAKEYVTDHDFAVLAGHTWHKGKCSCGKPTCDRPAKHPLTKNGVKDATKDIATVTHWWAQLRGLPNVAIATGAASGVDVIDLDVKSGGLDTLAAWKQEHGELPRTTPGRLPGEVIRRGLLWGCSAVRDVWRQCGRLIPGRCRGE